MSGDHYSQPFPGGPFHIWSAPGYDTASFGTSSAVVTTNFNQPVDGWESNCISETLVPVKLCGCCGAKGKCSLDKKHKGKHETINGFRWF